jgi:Immunity protein 31
MFRSFDLFLIDGGYTPSTAVMTTPVMNECALLCRRCHRRQVRYSPRICTAFESAKIAAALELVDLRMPMERRVKRYPQFRFGEVVRVVGWPEGTADQRGQEGTVLGFTPLDSGAGWNVAVWLPPHEEMWYFDEEELESTGVVEVEEEDGPRRVPADPSTHEKSFGAELAIRLYTEIEEGDAPEVVGSAEVTLRSLIAVEHVTWRGEVHWDEPYRYDLTLDVHTLGDSRGAFEQLVASRRSGWDRKVDDGWFCEFGWSREADETGEPFLAPRASHLSVYLTPWSDPSSRPVPRDRTHDPGLPGFTPSPPAAGYE